MRWLLTAFIPLLFLLPTPAAAQVSNTIDRDGGKTTTIGEQYDDIQDQGIIYANICKSSTADCPCRDEGRCTLEDILQVIANVMVFILAISGSLALLVFLSGAILWITSNGRPEKIQNGKLTMVRALVGLVIIFTSYAAVALVINILKEGEPVGTGETIEDVIGSDADAIIETSN